MKSKRLFTALIVLGLAGFSVPLAFGQTSTVKQTTTTKQVTTVKRSFTPVRVTATELKNIQYATTIKSVKSSVSLPGVLPIEVTSPKSNDVWDAGKEYLIQWAGADEDVRIYLVPASSPVGQRLTQVNIVNRAPNTGSYRFRVPYEWLTSPSFYQVRISTISDKRIGYSAGTISVFTQTVDLECLITDEIIKWESTDYLFYIEFDKWLEFNVLMRNKGTINPLTIQQVLVKIIKEPENIVICQEEWGFSGIYGHEWYRTPEPRKFDIHNPLTSDNNLNLKSGAYRVEVELDPTNLLGEKEQTRGDNKCVKHWNIR